MSIASALSSGATLITASARSARFWRRRYAALQREAGRRAWVDPRIFSYPEWQSQMATAQGGTAILTRWQEESLWEQAIAVDEAGAAVLMQPAAAARAARRAWNRIHAWRIPRAAGAWASSPDGMAFLGWVRSYESRLRHMNRTDGARLSTSIAPHDAGRILVAMHGDIEPAAALLLEQMAEAGSQVEMLAAPVAGKRTRVTVAAASDPGDEIEAAAAWAVERNKANPDARIGFVCVDLEAVRARVERVFRAAAGAAVHISLGPPLAERPLVAGALAALALTADVPPIDDWTGFLLSPYAGGGDLFSRAKLDVEMRRKRMEAAPMAAVSSLGACPGVLGAMLADAEGMIEGWPQRQSPDAWSAAWARLLARMGWPGEAQLSSEEYQVLESWHEALSDFAALGATLGPVSAETALAVFRAEVARRRFQVEDLGQPIQVMNVAEASGLEFDHLWVAGLHAEAWPSPPAPDPFVPLSLQRSLELPGSSAAVELQRARERTRLLAASADEVVFSFARAEGEKRLAPSPLLAAYGETEMIGRPVEWRPPPASFTEIDDRTGPPPNLEAPVTGGARILELYARCPFQGYAEMRMEARPLEAPELGFDLRDRGTILHAALAACWEELGSSAALRDWAAADIEAAISRAVERALNEQHPANEFEQKRLELEQERLRRLLAAWLDKERERDAAFTVLESERDREVEIGGIRLRTRIDRIDRLDGDGGLVLIDYKSTAPPASAWEGDRPESPQLPLYAVTRGERLSGALFAQVKAGEVKFSGLVTSKEVANLPRSVVSEDQFSDRLEAWRAALEGLAAQIRSGYAAVDPKKGEETCNRCHLQMLCRIHE
ncbi:MAG: PD-(D/E)XK nuclease family protein [Bryobacteraceae bacterium]